MAFQSRWGAAPPPMIAQSGPGPLAQLGNMALNKGLQYGISTAFGDPTGATGQFAKEAAQEILPGVIPRFYNDGGRLQQVQDRWGSGASYSPTEGYEGVYDIMQDGRRTGQVTDYWFKMRAQEAAAAEAAGDMETANKIKSEIANAADAPAPVAAPTAQGSYDITGLPLGELLGADWKADLSYQDMSHGQDPYSAGITGTWKFNEGGQVPWWKRAGEAAYDAAGDVGSVIIEAGDRAADKVAGASQAVDDYYSGLSPYGQGALDYAKGSIPLYSTGRDIYRIYDGATEVWDGDTGGWKKVAIGAAGLGSPLSGDQIIGLSKIGGGLYQDYVNPQQKNMGGMMMPMAYNNGGVIPWTQWSVANPGKSAVDYNRAMAAARAAMAEKNKPAQGGKGPGATADVVGALMRGFFNSGGSVHGPMHKDEKEYQMQHSNHLQGVAEYKNMGGRCGPLSKTVMKDKHGNSTERHYHNPMMSKPGGSDK